MAGYSELALLLISAYFVASVTVHVHADQSGFISIDCGSTKAYTDEVTGINYVPDMNYINSGQNNNITDIIYNDVTLDTHLRTVRSFPTGLRNCYTVQQEVNAVNGTRFLIRARFMYGNYDLMNQIPEFDLYIGVNLWTAIKMDNISSVTTVEMIHLTWSRVTSVCLVNKGSGTPFISVLETRIILDDTVYVLVANGSINLVTRANMVSGSKIRYRYPDDVYDRIWEPTELSSEVSYISTSESIDVGNGFNPPVVVMSTAVVASTASVINIYQNLDRGEGSDQYYYSYFHFAELQKLAANQTREFIINQLNIGNFSPTYLQLNTLYSGTPENMKSYNYSITETLKSTLAPILNAYEIYMYNSWDQLATNAADIEAMDALNSSYGESKIWQGDPCAPQNYSWEGISCIFKESEEPIITGLNLSSIMKGTISFDISKLKSLEKLDLSNNNLSGAVPEFISKLKSLEKLYLNNNNFSGTLPPTLVTKSSAGSLTLRTEKKSSVRVAVIIATVVVTCILLALLAVLCVCRKKIFKGRSDTIVVARSHLTSSSTDILKQKQRFSYSEIIKMTNNFRKVIGVGGFGTVYFGLLDNIQVAVKILSLTSSQGYKEFKAEAQLLTRVHHKNLTSLIGYCNDGDHLGLVYEYMANGNLELLISGANAHFLTWKDRLQIALDAAQGLDYLHHGCKPSIVHRDVKPTNILLDEKFQAKLADFGLSRDSLGNEREYESTVVAGTLGYLDPEYRQTERVNEKSDVFSFGVVLLRIITGKSTSVVEDTQSHISGDSQSHISGWVKQMISVSGDLKSIVDQRLKGEYDINSAWMAIELAMSCVSPTSAQRPNMSRVVTDLKQCLELEMGHIGERRTTEFSSIIPPYDMRSEQPSAR
ncbi:unnamed protein product [Rhodiola kirilowii]